METHGALGQFRVEHSEKFYLTEFMSCLCKEHYSANVKHTKCICTGTQIQNIWPHLHNLERLYILIMVMDCYHIYYSNNQEHMGDNFQKTLSSKLILRRI